jgi:hypothetical protein
LWHGFWGGLFARKVAQPKAMMTMTTTTVRIPGRNTTKTYSWHFSSGQMVRGSELFLVDLSFPTLTRAAVLFKSATTETLTPLSLLLDFCFYLNLQNIPTLIATNI